MAQQQQPQQRQLKTSWKKTLHSNREQSISSAERGRGREDKAKAAFRSHIKMIQNLNFISLTIWNEAWNGSESCHWRASPAWWKSVSNYSSLKRVPLPTRSPHRDAGRLFILKWKWCGQAVGDFGTKVDSSQFEKSRRFCGKQRWLPAALLHVATGAETLAAAAAGVGATTTASTTATG